MEVNMVPMLLTSQRTGCVSVPKFLAALNLFLTFPFSKHCQRVPGAVASEDFNM